MCAHVLNNYLLPACCCILQTRDAFRFYGHFHPNYPPKLTSKSCVKMTNFVSVLVVLSTLTLVINLTGLITFAILCNHHQEAVQRDLHDVTKAINKLDLEVKNIYFGLKTRYEAARQNLVQINDTMAEIAVNVNSGFTSLTSSMATALKEAEYLTKNDIDILIKRLINPFH